MLVRMPDCALPSLFAACHEVAARPGGRGFDLWPKTRWIWSFQLTLDGHAVLTKLHRGKSLYVSADTARLFDPLVRQSIDAATGDDARLLDHLARHGPSMADDIERMMEIEEALQAAEEWRILARKAVRDHERAEHKNETVSNGV